MPSTNAPFGFKPVFHPSGCGNPVAIPGGLASTYGTTLYRGQPVLMSASGNLNIAGATGAIIGIFDGCEYTDASGKRVVSPYWPASTAATDITAYVWNDPAIIYEVQADGSLAATSVGDEANASNLTSGSTYSGQSACTLSTTLAGAGSQAQFRIVGKSLRPDNDWGDTYTIVQVTVAQHQFAGSVVAV